ncbi:hypothetical protein RN001_002359 [Aquatica leii]|uniref:Uncharacterized protein n=1 Tax=Aquatica leii TaxID=1421715 RepID=A0AAN7PH52_9COLE|nr:hypothetical protein RN001_002359 [Aquatica leii]
MTNNKLDNTKAQIISKVKCIRQGPVTPLNKHEHLSLKKSQFQEVLVRERPNISLTRRNPFSKRANKMRH